MYKTNPILNGLVASALAGTVSLAGAEAEPEAGTIAANGIATALLHNGRGDSLCESGSIGGRDAEACCPSIPHDELERI